MRHKNRYAFAFEFDLCVFGYGIELGGGVLVCSFRGGIFDF